MHTDRERIIEHASVSARAVILYGSRARGDHRPDSDTDVLQVLREVRSSYAVEEIVFSNYTLPQLLKMARQGSLFVAHLVAEAKPILDPENLLGEVRAAYKPADYSQLISEVSWTARLLTESADAFHTQPLKYKRLAIHLARTIVYASAQLHGLTSFSVDEIWKHFVAEWGAPLPRVERMTWQTYLEVRGWIQERLHCEISNEFGTHEALIVNAWGASRLCVALGLRLLHEGDVLPAYEDTDLWGNMW